MLPNSRYVCLHASESVIGYAINAINAENCFHNFSESLYDRKPNPKFIFKELRIYRFLHYVISCYTIVESDKYCSETL